MLDTRLKKTHNLTILIIALIILLPAFVLVSLYPRMEEAALKKKDEYQLMYEEQRYEYEQEYYQKELNNSFVHMATEASYYLYGSLMREAKNTYIDMSILEEYGWKEDYYTIQQTTEYYAEMLYNNESHVTTNSDWDMSPLLTMTDNEVMEKLNEHILNPTGFLKFKFNSYGEIENAEIYMKDGVWADLDCYSLVTASMNQYHDNALYWNEREEGWDPDELIPKNLTVIFALKDAEYFVYDLYPDDYYYGFSWHSLYVDIGAIVPIIICAVFVAFAALLLPFVKKLETGWEKLFCLPLEVIIALVLAGMAGAYGMFLLMSYTNMSDIQMIAQSENAVIDIIGVPISPSAFYNILLAVNFIGWGLCFLAEYVVAASFRQFLCDPVRYLRERVLIIRFLRWIKKQCIRLYDYVTDIHINEEMHRSIIKIVLVNFVILALLCCLWLFGIVGVIIYSIALYVLLKRYGEKVQVWYQSLLNTTHQMASGNLKVSVADDLGLFQELGTELREVQKGFSKAVIEEARSQNMKTELITNVSHDLKTPLTAMITYIDLMKKEDLTDGERNAYLNIVDQKSQRLKVLIDDLFEVSKAASGSIQMNFMDVDVVSLMKQVRLEMEEKITESELVFKWNLPEEKIVLSLDGQKTYRIFENLLNNVLKYSLPHSRVYVDILNRDEEVQIMFRNISATELTEEPNYLTERFVRGDASRKTDGSGLGLAIVKSFVELQNGKLDISIDGDLFKVSIVWNK